jgi:hypothetical protein
MMHTYLADVLRAHGCKVREPYGNWKTRAHGQMGEFRGIIIHHTGSAGMPGSRNVVYNGRSDLAGPLSQLTLDPDGYFSCISAGMSWHAGTGDRDLIGVPKSQGNFYLLGIEGVSDGKTWTSAQREAYPKGVAAILHHHGVRKAEKWVIGHKEWAPSRKWDPGNWDMNAFRAEVNRWLDIFWGQGAPAQPQKAKKGEESKVNAHVEYYEDGTFRAYGKIEVASNYAHGGWLVWSCAWGRLENVTLHLHTDTGEPFKYDVKGSYAEREHGSFGIPDDKPFRAWTLEGNVVSNDPAKPALIAAHAWIVPK